jgi:16S rRNA C1402 (ribose-2'-O) methylase RsmI
MIIEVDDNIKVFPKNIVFGSRDIGNILDNSLSLILHIVNADIIVVENINRFQTLLNNLKIKTNAEILDMNYNDTNIQKINKYILDSYKNKKILYLSDEGSSITCDPGFIASNLLNKNNIEYYVMPGASSIMTAINYLEFIGQQKFYFGGMLAKGTNETGIGQPHALIDDKDIKHIFDTIKHLSVPSLLFTISDLFKETIDKVISFFGKDCNLIVFKNLTMSNQNILYGNSEYFFNNNLVDGLDTVCFVINMENN